MSTVGNVAFDSKTSNDSGNKQTAPVMEKSKKHIVLVSNKNTHSSGLWEESPEDLSLALLRVLCLWEGFTTIVSTNNNNLHTAMLRNATELLKTSLKLFSLDLADSNSPRDSDLKSTISDLRNSQIILSNSLESSLILYIQKHILSSDLSRQLINDFFNVIFDSYITNTNNPMSQVFQLHITQELSKVYSCDIILKSWEEMCINIGNRHKDMTPDQIHSRFLQWIFHILSQDKEFNIINCKIITPLFMKLSMDGR
jgi:hypothetical protein